MYIFLVPNVSCPAECIYCNGPHRDTPTMDPRLALNVINWAYDLNNSLQGPKSQFEVAFHGGEPLMAGIKFYEQILKRWEAQSLNAKFSLQSNLWLLTPELVDLFLYYKVQIGTSLDGPKNITDLCRRPGYYERTLTGLMLAKDRLLDVNAIATITKEAAPHIMDVLCHFTDLHIDFKVNPAVPRLNAQSEDSRWILPPDNYGTMMIELLHAYLSRVNEVRIENLDRDCRAITSGRAITCTYIDCLGKCLAVDPQGYIFPCMRFIGHMEFCLGRYQEFPSWHDLRSSKAWSIISERNSNVQKECQDCAFWPICQGGCPYNWLAKSNSSSYKDPYCIGYRKYFEEIASSAISEMLTETNAFSLFSSLCNSSQRSRKAGPILDIMNERTHPDGITASYRRIIAAFVIAYPSSFIQKVRFLIEAGISRTSESAKQSLNWLQMELSKPYRRAKDVYLHVTNVCSLGCVHCYASSSPGDREMTMKPEAVSEIILEAAALGYRRVVITGGEPLEHPHLWELIRVLTHIRTKLNKTLIGLRTNLMRSVDPNLARALEAAFDQVVVSIDGDLSLHNARRHPGAYEKVVQNLKLLLSLSQNLIVRLAALLDGSATDHFHSKAVNDLAKELGIRSVVLRTPKPLGRAIRWIDWEHHSYTTLPLDEAIRRRLYPRGSCGRGTNLHIEANGQVFACYADLPSSADLGRWPEENLTTILKKTNFRSILRANVDESERCSECLYRYLCGGMCMAWSHAANQGCFAIDQICSERKSYAKLLLKRAIEQLNIPVELFNKWFGINMSEEKQKCKS